MSGQKKELVLPHRMLFDYVPSEAKVLVKIKSELGFDNVELEKWKIEDIKSEIDYREPVLFRKPQKKVTILAYYKIIIR